MLVDLNKNCFQIMLETAKRMCHLENQTAKYRMPVTWHEELIIYADEIKKEKISQR